MTPRRRVAEAIAKMVRGPNQTSFVPGTTVGTGTRFSTGRQPAKRNPKPPKPMVYDAPMTPDQRKRREADRMAVSRFVQSENKQVFADAAREERRNISTQMRQRALDRRIDTGPAYSPDSVAKALVKILIRRGLSHTP